MERPRLSGSFFKMGIILFVIAVTRFQYARADVPSLVSRETRDEDDAETECFQMMIDKTDCANHTSLLDIDIADEDILVEIIVNDVLEYNDSLEAYCDTDGDHSESSDGTDAGGSFPNYCNNIPYVLSSRGCGFAASTIADGQFTVRFYDENEGLNLKCSSNISQEVVDIVTMGKYHYLSICLPVSISIPACINMCYLSIYLYIL